MPEGLDLERVKTAFIEAWCCIEYFGVGAFALARSGGRYGCLEVEDTIALWLAGRFYHAEVENVLEAWDLAEGMLKSEQKG